jgi:alkyldihydroxyacetonephosphate synthase
VKVTIDEKSLLAEADGQAKLGEVEAALRPRGLTLDVEGASASNQTVAAWLAHGAAGARDGWRDPVDHLVAGLDAVLEDGRRVAIRPAPRRAVGPDLVALFVGMGERFGKVERAFLRVHRVGVKRPDHGTVSVPPDPEVSAVETRLLDALGASLARPPTG